MAPSVPTDPTIHGVKPGALPWVLREGEARLRRDGRLDVRLRGLIIPTMGNAGPVTTVSASLYCGADATKAVAATRAVPLSRSGRARIRARLTLPAKCLAPILLVDPNGSTTAYIAASGFAR
jgi:hypothetical protein